MPSFDDFDDFNEDDLAVIDAAVGEHQSQAAAIDAAARRLGIAALQPWQVRAVNLAMGRRDCVILSGTGSGKSCCFQLPPLISGGTAIVISPLISLMRDQVSSLSSKGVNAVFLGSAQPDASAESRALAGEFSLLYVCPETLFRLLPGLRLLHACQPFSMLAVDEAHCTAQWGHDFRPQYGRLGRLREELPDVPIMALTATATPAVREEIIRVLALRSPEVLQNRWRCDSTRNMPKPPTCQPVAPSLRPSPNPVVAAS